MRKVGKVTAADKAALDLIRACGFVRLDARGEPCLETNSQIGLWRFQRLVEHGLLISNEDALPGQLAAAQSYRPVAPCTS